MDEVGRRHVVVVVPNRITGDSRVIKTALAAARAGWRVTLLGQGRRRRQETRLGPVRVVRVPINRPHHDAYEQGLRVVTTRRHPLAYTGPTQARAAGERLGRHIARRRAGAEGAARDIAEAELLLRRVLNRARRWCAGRETVRTPDVPLDQVDWRRDWPILVDWEQTFGPVIEELEPDLVHANDAIMIGVAAQAVRRLRERGRQVAWIYDAHEHVSAVDWGTPLRSAAFRAYEREFIREADAVVTVSPEIAEALRTEHGLAEAPVVVRNAPVQHVDTKGTPRLRDVVGAGPDVPLIVYSGYVEPRRGLVTVVEALPLMPEVRLVLVTSAVPDGGGPLGDVMAAARAAGVADRVLLAPYVEPYQVPAYLASADLGLFPGLRYANQENSLPTKLPEYLHAGLPLVVSDLRTMAEFARSHGVGEVFTAGDPASLAEAVGRVLADPARYRRNITDPLLDDLSWERQAVTLTDLYARLTGHRPQPVADPVGWNVVETTTTGEPLVVA